MTVKLEAIRPKKFALIDPDRTRANVRRSMKRYLDEIKAILQNNYYSVPNSKTYQRTHDLQRGWRITMSADGTDGFLYNDVDYAVFAQGPRGGGRGKGERQAQHMRARGWLSITDVARDTAPRFKQLMNRSVQGSSDYYADE